MNPKLAEKLGGFEEKVRKAALRAVASGYSVVEDSLLGGGPHAIPQPTDDPSKPDSQPHLHDVVRDSLVMSKGRLNTADNPYYLSAGFLDRSVLDSYTVSWQRQDGTIMFPESGKKIPVWKLYEFGSSDTTIMQRETGHKLTFYYPAAGKVISVPYVNKPELPAKGERPPASTFASMSDLFNSPDADRGYAPIRHAFRKLAIVMPTLFRQELAAVGIKSKRSGRVVSVGKYKVGF
jgi:hypothetical protein